MEKQKIVIQKIKENRLIERIDEVAVEQAYEIVLQNGEKIAGFCTPTHMEEMILGSRFLAGDFSEKEKEQFVYLTQEKEALCLVNVEEVFHAAEQCFENPGSLFSDTGCAHSCALIYEGKVICQMEDIGRYNALDKVIGYALKHHIPCSEAYIFASGRISLEYMRKVIAAGFPMAVSRAAVTKAAVDAAKKENITLLGFIRKNSGNIYCEGKVKLNEQSR